MSDICCAPRDWLDRPVEVIKHRVEMKSEKHFSSFHSLVWLVSRCELAWKSFSIFLFFPFNETNELLFSVGVVAAHRWVRIFQWVKHFAFIIATKKNRSDWNTREMAESARRAKWKLESLWTIFHADFSGVWMFLIKFWCFYKLDYKVNVPISDIVK